ncbi:MAG: hypothetical protein Q8P27_00745 [Candidatus Peregrinibacteria bacterium]|nr:hypothetical protein [Candidatus Peregrinibacteria bacterium]
MHLKKSKGKWSDTRFWVMIGIFVLALILFHDRPQIAMWIGFILAGYSAIANDSIQTLGTFISSNSKVKWWVLWLYLGGILVAVFTYGWMQGDIAFERLTKIPEVTDFNFWQLFAPVALLVLTQFRMPVSTTFLLLSVFSSSKTVGSMLNKTFIGYFVAFVSAFVIWGVIAELMKHKKFFKEKYNKKTWRVFQWFATAYLWSTWLMQDTANIVVFLPRDLPKEFFLAVIILMFLGMGFLLYIRGGRIQEIITEKTDVADVRSASIIDLVLGTLLLIFKEWNNLPMSTTWVFLGLLAGREIALSRLSGNEKPYLRTLGLVTKDLAFASIGIVVSIAIAVAANGDFQLSEIVGVLNIFR